MGERRRIVSAALADKPQNYVVGSVTPGSVLIPGGPCPWLLAIGDNDHASSQLNPKHRLPGNSASCDVSFPGLSDPIAGTLNGCHVACVPCGKALTRETYAKKYYSDIYTLSCLCPLNLEHIYIYIYTGKPAPGCRDQFFTGQLVH